MGFYREQVYPRLYQFIADPEKLERTRAELVGQGVGHVLEIGAGTGANFLYYSEATTSLTTVEPNVLMNAIARKRIRYLDFPVDQRQQSAEQLTMRDHSFDTVVSTLALCCVADPRAVLAQIRRVLKPGGKLLFLEKCLADDEPTRRWQQRLTPCLRRLSGGCVLDRPIAGLISDAGFTFEWTREYRMSGLPLGLGNVIEGAAKVLVDGSTRV